MGSLQKFSKGLSKVNCQLIRGLGDGPNIEGCKSYGLETDVGVWIVSCQEHGRRILLTSMRMPFTGFGKTFLGLSLDQILGMWNPLDLSNGPSWIQLLRKI